jgi:hypothetical protein
VVLPMPPMEMTTAKARQRHACIEQESRASHQTPLPRVTPMTRHTKSAIWVA